MTCDHRLWGDADGLPCTRTDAHTTHSFAASAGADLSNEGGEDVGD